MWEEHEHLRADRMLLNLIRYPRELGELGWIWLTDAGVVTDDQSMTDDEIFEAIADNYPCGLSAFIEDRL